MSHNNLGYAYAKIAEEAIKLLPQSIIKKRSTPIREAIRLKPDYAKALNNLGSVYNKLGTFPQAIESARRGDYAQTRLAEAQYNLGTAYYIATVQRVGSALQLAVKLKPDFADAFNSLGSALYQAQKFDQAIEVYKRAISLKPKVAETHNNLGKVYYRAKRNQEAVAAFKAAIQLKPNFGEAHFSLAVAYVALGDKKGVLEEYKILKTIDPVLAEKFGTTFLKPK